jgi:hypothetical protein
MKPINVILIILFLCFMAASTAATLKGAEEPDRRLRIKAKAYDQSGIFCGYWNDDDVTGDGYYGYDIKVNQEVFSFTIDLASREEEERAARIPKGTPIKFDFKVSMAPDLVDDDIWGAAVTLTKIQTAPGEAKPEGCPANQ